MMASALSVDKNDECSVTPNDPTLQCARHPEYCDFAGRNSTRVANQRSGDSEQTKRPATGPKPQFPTKLHRMVGACSTSPELSAIVSWLPHGRAFKIYDRNQFISKLLPRYFERQNTYGSFQRQLNMYGFLQLTGHHADHGAYYHPLFLRGRPTLSEAMSRPHEGGTGKAVRRRLDPRSEPKFYQMPPVFDEVSLSPIPWQDATCRKPSNPTSGDYRFCLLAGNDESSLRVPYLELGHSAAYCRESPRVRLSECHSHSWPGDMDEAAGGRISDYKAVRSMTANMQNRGTSTTTDSAIAASEHFWGNDWQPLAHAPSPSTVVKSVSVRESHIVHVGPFHAMSHGLPQDMFNRQANAAMTQNSMPCDEMKSFGRAPMQSIARTKAPSVPDEKHMTSAGDRHAPFSLFGETVQTPKQTASISDSKEMPETLSGDSLTGKDENSCAPVDNLGIRMSMEDALAACDQDVFRRLFNSDIVHDCEIGCTDPRAANDTMEE